MASSLYFDIFDGQTLPRIGPVIAEGTNDTGNTLRVQVWCGDFYAHQPGSAQDYYEVPPGPFDTLIFEFDHDSNRFNETVEGKLFDYGTSVIEAPQICYDVNFLELGGGMEMEIPWREVEKLEVVPSVVGYHIPAKLYKGSFRLMEAPVLGYHARFVVLGRLPNGRTVIEYDRTAYLTWHITANGNWYASFFVNILTNLPTEYPARAFGILLDGQGKRVDMVAAS